MNKNIVLIGFMGTGKSEVGKELAKKMGYAFIDTDDLIEKRERISISGIFEKYGEPYFRKAESEIIEEVSKKDGVVISTGGGAVIKKENIENLKKNSVMVCLTASPESIYERVRDANNRPLLKINDPLTRIKELLKEREEYYSQADMTLDTSDKSTADIVNIILERVGTGRPADDPEGKGRLVVNNNG
jgi:shikimate kinase